MKVGYGARRISPVQRKESVANGRFRVGWFQDFYDFSTAMTADFMVEKICYQQ